MKEFALMGPVPLGAWDPGYLKSETSGPLRPPLPLAWFSIAAAMDGGTFGCCGTPPPAPEVVSDARGCNGVWPPLFAPFDWFWFVLSYRLFRIELTCWFLPIMRYYYALLCGCWAPPPIEIRRQAFWLFIHQSSNVWSLPAGWGMQMWHHGSSMTSDRHASMIWLRSLI